MSISSIYQKLIVPAGSPRLNSTAVVGVFLLYICVFHPFLFHVESPAVFTNLYYTLPNFL